MAHASAHAEQLRGRSRSPKSGRAPTSRIPLFRSHARQFDRALSQGRTRTKGRAMPCQRLLLASVMMKYTMNVPVAEAVFQRALSSYRARREEEGQLAEGSHCQTAAPRTAQGRIGTNYPDCFKVYRKERCWCGVQRFSRIGGCKGFLSDLPFGGTNSFIHSFCRDCMKISIGLS